MFYYAVLNEKDIVVNIESLEESVDYFEYIPITSEDWSLCDKWYDRNGKYGTVGAFIDPPISVLAAHCTGEISYKDEDVWLDEKLDSYATQSSLNSGLATKASLNHNHSASAITETDSQKIMTAAERTKLSGIAENANNYIHPENHPASMITGLSNVATSGNYADLTNKPTIPEAYTHPASHPASMISGLASVATSGSYDDLTDKPSIPTIPESLPANGGNADTVDGYHAAAFAQAQHNHDLVYSNLDHTHSEYAASTHNHDESYANASHVHDIDEITGLETALAGKANVNHTEHNGEIIANKTAGVGITLQSSYGKTRIHKNSNATTDYGTIISDYDTDGKRDYIQLRRNSPSAERKLFLMSENQDGSVAQYKIYGEHNKPGILWSGVVFPGGDSTMTLSKNISDCRGGIILLWCDYDSDTSTTNNNEFVTTIIPRISPTGGNWNGESFYCEVPRHIGNDTYDVTTESRVIKKVKVYNGKLEGYVENARGLRSDVILRAIYEY